MIKLLASKTLPALLQAIPTQPRLKQTPSVILSPNKTYLLQYTPYNTPLKQKKHPKKKQSEYTKRKSVPKKTETLFLSSGTRD
jgi:hypothetical protein